jgi:pimeloyl-ACP methyl ester carboxylesterase
MCGTVFSGGPARGVGRARRARLGSWLFGVPLLGALACDGSDETRVVPLTEPLPGAARWEPVTCQYSAMSRAECGYVIVPENRREPLGPTVKVYVAVFPGSPSSGGAETGPLFYLTGGPGASTEDAYVAFEAVPQFVDTFGDERDVVVIDQRGTNYSTPGLYCSTELGPLRPEIYAPSFATAAAQRVTGIEQCRERLLGSGIDLSAYTTQDIMEDVKAVRDVLGYEQINIYGVSYGTRLTMAIMRNYPEMLRSIVLDSVLPPEVNPFVEESPGTLFALDSLFAAAASDFPRLRDDFYTVLAHLEAQPAAATGHHYASNGDPSDDIPVTVSGEKFVSYVVAGLKETPYDPGLPLSITTLASAAAPDYTAVADAWVLNMDFFFPVGEGATGATAVGLFESVFGANDAFYTSPAQVREAILETTDNPSIQGWLENNFINMEPIMLGGWPVVPEPESVRDPLTSSIPTLMLVGTLDQATPSIFSEPARPGLTESFYFKIPAGHATAALPCVDDMLNAFVKEPSLAPANGCGSSYVWTMAN